MPLSGRISLGIHLRISLAVLVSNAINDSTNNSRVIVKISQRGVLARGESNNPIEKSTSSRIHHESNRENIFLTFLVQDFGYGISAVNLKDLIDPFIHLQHGDYSKGSGFSLYICKQMIERHGGKLECVSEVGMGSSFSFTLPLKLCHEVEVTQNNGPMISVPDMLELLPRAPKPSIHNNLFLEMLVHPEEEEVVVVEQSIAKIKTALVVDGMTNMHLTSL